MALSDLIDTAAEAGSKRQSMSAIHIPLPFGLKPLNVQLSQDLESGMGMTNSMIDDAKQNGTNSNATRIETEEMPQMSKAQKESLERARHVCLEKSQTECDKALDEYHRLRFNKSPLEDEKIMRQTEPQSVGGFLGQGLATWMVPGLGAKLREMTASKSESVEKEKSTTDDEKATTEKPIQDEAKNRPKSPFSEIRRHPSRRRLRLELPARGGQTEVPKTRRRTSKLALVPR
ncbi:hypothetical protein L596_007341 [Steinernema carpocapsae]|uniref:Uncharacterized protein n=1 Tax=Steinernema carpocapsae TaxID=34508 RepID=A0A4V6A5Z5_STECR|nr:hypothetical protein L596_007341 [Steinernema carpocapsae]